jgi:hypothetical protein
MPTIETLALSRVISHALRCEPASSAARSFIAEHGWLAWGVAAAQRRAWLSNRTGCLRHQRTRPRAGPVRLSRRTGSAAHDQPMFARELSAESSHPKNVGYGVGVPAL